MSVTLTNASITLQLNWNISASNAGAPATTNAASWNPKLSYTQGSSAGGATDYISTIMTLSAGANSTYDLTSTFSDLVGVTGISILTVRTFIIWLLSTSQAGPDGVTVGTAASYITVGAAATSQAFTAAGAAGFFTSTAAAGNAVNGGWWGFGVANAGGFTAGASYSKLKVLNNDGGAVATFAMTMIITN